MLWWAPTAALGGHDIAVDEGFAAPHSPRLPSLQGAGEAGFAHWAGAAQGFGVFDVGLPLGEPQVGVTGLLAR